MSVFLDFVQSAARAPARSPNDVIPAETARVILSEAGYFVNRTRIQVTRLKPVLDEMIASLPNVQNGPQTILQRLYNCISAISGILSQSAQEQDKRMPPNLHVIGLISEAFQYLGQFHPYLPSLMSPTECTKMAPAVPQLIACIQAVQATLDKLLALIPQCEAEVLKQAPPVNIAENPLAHLAAATVVAAENVIVDLSFMMNNENVAQSEITPVIGNWVAVLAQYTYAASLQTLANPQLLLATTSNLLGVSPPLLTVLDNVEKLAGGDSSFYASVARVIEMMQLVNSIESRLWVDYAKAVASLIPFVYQQKKEPAEIVEACGRMMAVFTNHVGAPAARDAEVTEATCRAMLEQFPTSHDAVAFVAATVTRCLAAMASEMDSGEDVLVSLAVELNKLLLALLPAVQGVVNEVVKVYNDNLVSFGEAQLGCVNYYCRNILSVTALDVNAPGYVAQLDSLAGLVGGLSEAIQRLGSACTDAQLVMKCTDLAKRASEICPVFTKWAGEVLHCMSSLVDTRGRHLASMFSFLSAAGQLPPEIASQESVIASTIASSMNRFLIRDVGACGKIVKVISELRPLIPSLSLAQPQVKCASSIFGAISKPFPACVESFVETADATNNDRVVVALHSITATVPGLVDTAVKNSAAVIQSLAYLLAPACSHIVRAIEILPSEMGSGFSDGVKQTLDTVWKIAVESSAGDRPIEFDSLPNLANALKQMLNELHSAAMRKVQPFIECELPESVKQLRSIENIVSGLTGKIHQAAQNLTTTFKGLEQPAISAFMGHWMNSARDSANLDFDGTSSIFTDAGSRYISSKEGNRDTLLAAFAPLSVCTCLLSAGEQWEPVIANIYDKQIECVKKIGVAATPNQWEPGLRELLGHCEAAATIKRCIALDKDAKMSALLDSLSRSMTSMHRVRVKSGNQQEIELAESAASLKTTEILLKQLGMDGVLANVLQPAFNMVVNANVDVPTMGGYLFEFAKKWRELQGMDIYATTSITDIDKLLDIIYDQLGIYRDSSTHILTSAKAMDATDEVLSKQLTTIASCSSLSCAIALRSLDVMKFRETPLITTFLRSSIGIVMALSQCVRPVEQITVMPADSQSHEIRLHARKIARMFDNLIDMIEAPDKQAQSLDDFTKLKLAFLSKLANVVNVLCFLTWTTCNAFVPEMFATDKQKLEAALQSALAEVKPSVDALMAKAVGSTKDDFLRSFTEVQQAMNGAIAASVNTDYSANFIARVIVCESLNVSRILDGLLTATESLVDHVVLDPDPDAAAKLGDDYSLPPLPSNSRELDDAFAFYSQSKSQWSAALDDFNRTLAEKMALSATILGAYGKLKTAMDTFATGCMTLAISTPDPRLQVEQHTALHTLSDAFACVKDALRSRLMRADGFEAEMTEAMNTLSAAFKQVDELAQAASKCPKPTAAANDDDENLDEVSRELKASAVAIEEMSARLQSFSDQIDATGVVFSDEDIANIDLEAEKGTLPAFVIANANPILVAAQRILTRAQQITAEMIAKYGKIENEKLLIRAAQEVSESAALLLICAEILMQGEDNDADFKAITAAKIIRASIASLVAQVLVKGGDREGIMDQQVKIVKQHADKIVSRAEKIVLEKTKVAESKVKKVGPKLVQKLNLQDRINKVRVQLQNQEKVLYQFRKRF